MKKFLSETDFYARLSDKVSEIGNGARYQLMTTAEKQNFIQQASQQGRIRWKVHGMQRRMQRLPFTLQQVEQSLIDCEIIEDYPHLHRSLPDCLVLSSIDGSPVHTVIAIDEAYQQIFIITVYQPNLGEWKNDWKTRRKN